MSSLLTKDDDQSGGQEQQVKVKATHQRWRPEWRSRTTGEGKGYSPKMTTRVAVKNNR